MNRPTSRPFLALATALVAASLGAQQLFFDTVDVAVVNLEVTVTDRDGNPVTGLVAEDFIVREDGREVEVSNFFAVAPDAPEPAAGPDVAPEMETPLPLRRTERLSMVVVLDELNLEPKSRNTHLDGLRSWLDANLSPGDQVMVVSITRQGVRVLQPFTDDRMFLLQAVDEAARTQSAAGRIGLERRALITRLERASLSSRDSNPGIAENPFGFDAAMSTAEGLARDVEQLAGIWYQEVSAALDVLSRFTDTLAGMPGRKALVYVSDGIPAHTGRALAQAYLNKYETWVLTQGADEVRDELSRMRTIGNRSDLSIQDRLEETIAKAAANRVAFYPVARTTGGSASHVSAEFAGAGTSSGVGPRSADVVAVERTERESSLIQLAGGTGGTAFVGTPTMTSLIDRLAQDFRSFYSIGYHAPRAADNEMHEIEIEIRDRPDLEVRHPEKVRRKTTLEALADITLSSLAWDVESNPLQVSLEPGTPEKGSKKGLARLPLLVKIPFEKILLLPEEAAHAGKLTVMVAVEDPETGNRSDVRRIDLPINVPNEQLLSALGQTAGTQIELELREGRSRIAVGVHDHLARVDSAIRIDLDVERPG